VRVAVNVSAVQLAQRDLVERIVRLLQRYEIPPEFLELEMTETAVLHNPARALAALRALKAAGVSICIDDFGTGYSSLTYLRSFPIDRIKIDRLFICNIAEEPSDATIVGALITMAHALGITVVAEGVETEEQAAILRTLGCDFVQGYFYGPAVAGAEIQERLRSRVAVTDDGSRSTVAR
jgi:EAL domain-containing protein (putative c-di-GMP-specific phosphodiesterase class I)